MLCIFFVRPGGGFFIKLKHIALSNKIYVAFDGYICWFLHVDTTGLVT